MADILVRCPLRYALQDATVKDATVTNAWTPTVPHHNKEPRKKHLLHSSAHVGHLNATLQTSASNIFKQPNKHALHAGLLPPRGPCSCRCWCFCCFGARKPPPSKAVVGFVVVVVLHHVAVEAPHGATDRRQRQKGVAHRKLREDLLRLKGGRQEGRRDPHDVLPRWMISNAQG